jgi:copper chaperone CopZ
MKNRFKLIGLTCEACVKLSSKRLAKIAGVTGLEIDLPSGQAELEADREISVSEVNQALADTDFRAQLI